jgi:hypothetical protein
LLAEATAASQLRARSVSLVAEALVFSGGGTVLSCCRVTVQSSRASWSPTVVETTTLYPALPSVPFASEYFFPTTVGDEAACAGTALTMIAAIAADAIADPQTIRRRCPCAAIEPMIHDGSFVVTQAFPPAVVHVGIHCMNGEHQTAFRFSSVRIQLVHNRTAEPSQISCVRPDVEVDNVHPPRESSSHCRVFKGRLRNWSTVKEMHMKVARFKALAALTGMGAVGAAIILNVGPATSANNVAGGSGDSSTVGEYTSPTIPAMSVNPTAMTLGATATAAPPQATMATEDATPTLKASPAPGCVNNGQCP